MDDFENTPIIKFVADILTSGIELGSDEWESAIKDKIVSIWNKKEKVLSFSLEVEDEIAFCGIHVDSYMWGHQIGDLQKVVKDESPEGGTYPALEVVLICMLNICQEEYTKLNEAE